MSDFEVIAIDDGSTDSSFAEFKRAAANDTRFRILQQANGGVSRARNAGIRASTAQWVAFLDADDEWAPEFLATIVDLVERHPCVVIAGTGYDVIRGGRVVARHVASFGGGRSVVAQAVAFFKAWERAGACPLFVGAAAAKRSALLDIGGFESGMNLGEELLMFIRLLEHGSLAYAPMSLASYHLSTAGSLATSPSVDAIRRHGLLLSELARQVQLGRCPKSVYVKWQHIQADYLMQSGLRAELLKQLFSEPGIWGLRMWIRALLEAVGARMPLKRLLGCRTPP